MNKLIGKVAYIKNNIDSIYAGEWGTIIGEDDGEYSIAIANGSNSCPIFYRNEFVIRREKKQLIRLYTNNL